MNKSTLSKQNVERFSRPKEMEEKDHKKVLRSGKKDRATLILYTKWTRECRVILKKNRMKEFMIFSSASSHIHQTVHSTQGNHNQSGENKESIRIALVFSKFSLKKNSLLPKIKQKFENFHNHYTSFIYR